MKKGIHPENYRPVVFKDMSNGDMFLSRSTCNTKDTIEFEGETYPLVKLEISNTSHPFYTGKSKLVDTAGRVDKFMSRYGNRLKMYFETFQVLTIRGCTMCNPLLFIFVSLKATVLPF